MVLMNSGTLAFGSSCSTQLYFPLEWLSSKVADPLTPVLAGSMTISIFVSRWLWEFSTLLHSPPLEHRISWHVSPTDGWLRSSSLIWLQGFSKHHTPNISEWFSFRYKDPLTRVLIKWMVQIFSTPYWIRELFNLIHLLIIGVLNL